MSDDFQVPQGWGIKYGSDKCPEGFIEFSHPNKIGEMFWRQSIKAAYDYLGGPAI